jgi:NADPH-dependent ferric siderophore reductase
LFIQGPGGAYSPSADADWHLLVGDESALPAIAAAVDQLPADAVARIVVEVYGPADEIDLGRPVTWVHTGTAPVGQHLVETVRNVDWPTGAVQAFVHGEAGFVKALRYHLKVERGVTADQLSISGYWRLGSDDEGWRAAKAAWNAEAEAAEAAVTV